MCPTPLVYFSLFHLEVDGAIQVTGSHNPPDQNGFKICVGKTTIHGDDDGIYAACRMLEIVARAGRSLAELLADLPPAVNTPEIRVDCPDALKFTIAEKAKDRFRKAGYDIIDVDGVRVKFPEGWGLIRASKTQPVLVMRFEASTPEKLAEYRAAVERVLDEVKREVGA